MSILNNTDWDAIDLSRPLLSKGTVRAKLGKVEEEEKERDSGIVSSGLLIPLILTHDHTDIEGKKVHAGFAWTDRISTIRPGKTSGALTDGQMKSNEINGGLMKEFLCAALGLPKSTSGMNDAAAALVAQGGWSALAGKEVICSVDVRTDREDETKKYQTVKHYSAIPAA